MTLQLHRPDGRGGLERVPRREADIGRELRAKRWLAGPLRNVEMNPTSTPMSILFWIGLAALTFVLLVAGYGTHFWH